MRLHRLTGLEQEKLTTEYEEILGIGQGPCWKFFPIPVRLMTVIREELEEILEKYGDERRTVILEGNLISALEDLITEEDVVVTISHGGYAKSQSLDRYQAQRRGGKGKSATKVKEEDFIDEIICCQYTRYTFVFHLPWQNLLAQRFTNCPRPAMSVEANRLSIFCHLEKDERVNAVLTGA